MVYQLTPAINFPLDKYQVNSYKFKQKCSYHKKYWGVHLGEDINIKAGTKVKACGRGKVIYAALHPGSQEQPNWGNIIIIAHKNFQTKKTFFSLYAHLSKRLVKKGERVELGDTIGFVGFRNTRANGWWSEAHLHFAIYVGPWKGQVLPGYWKLGFSRTELRYWEKPSKFIKKYEHFSEKNKI